MYWYVRMFEGDVVIVPLLIIMVAIVGIILFKTINHLRN